ncbi:MAG: hypothetical protein AB1773_08550 [Pseudomonadota bacterium]
MRYHQAYLRRALRPDRRERRARATDENETMTLAALDRTALRTSQPQVRASCPGAPGAALSHPPTPAVRRRRAERPRSA